MVTGLSRCFQGNTVTLAHSDDPYTRKYEKLMETRFHELLVEHGLKMLLKPHSQTSERRGYEAGKERQEKRERKEAHP